MIENLINKLISFLISGIFLVAVGRLFLAMVHGLLKKLIDINADLKKYAQSKGGQEGGKKIMKINSFFTFCLIMLSSLALVELITFCLRKLARRLMHSCTDPKKFPEAQKRPRVFETEEERRQFLGGETQRLFEEIFGGNKGFVLIISPSAPGDTGDLITNLPSQHIPEICAHASAVWSFYYGDKGGRA